MNAKIMIGKSAGGLMDYLNRMKEKNPKDFFLWSQYNIKPDCSCCLQSPMGKQFFQDKGQDGTSGNQFLAQRPGKAD